MTVNCLCHIFKSINQKRDKFGHSIISTKKKFRQNTNSSMLTHKNEKKLKRTDYTVKSLNYNRL
jgi:hypothetical protein